MGRASHRSMMGATPAYNGAAATGTTKTVPNTDSPTTTSFNLMNSKLYEKNQSTKSPGDSSSLSSVFQFTAGPLPTKLVFKPSSTNCPQSLKRGRPLDDVDGEHSSQARKKKRRLRLFLVTSRLSPVYSQPATHIVDRGSSKIAVWAKQRALGRNLLRKAAIMNCKRLRERKEQRQQQQQQYVMQQRQMEMARQTFMYGSHDTLTHPVVCTQRAMFPREPRPSGSINTCSDGPATTNPNFPYSTATPNSPLAPPLLVVRGPYVHHLPLCSAKADDGVTAVANRKMAPPTAQVPRRDYIPLPPSPLGLSNYDALDLEDELPFDDDEENDADDDASSFTSSFGSAFSSANDGWSSLGASGDRKISPSASPPTIYSDFSVLDPMEAVVDDHDLIEAFAGTSTTALEAARNDADRRREAELRKAEERMAEMREEKERQRRVLFAGLSAFKV